MAARRLTSTEELAQAREAISAVFQSPKVDECPTPFKERITARTLLPLDAVTSYLTNYWLPSRAPH